MRHILLKNRFYRIVLLLLIIQVSAFLCSGLVQAGLEQEECSGNNSALVTGKGMNCISITNHAFNISSKYVLVTPHTGIFDMDGKRIRFKDLKVPCIAKIVLDKGRRSEPEVKSLTVREYDKYASPKFTIKRPSAKEPY